jgi:hypothetical protein
MYDRVYDLHRPRGCTVLAIEVSFWPGNEFGLWLPETVFVGGEVVWGNWMEDATQSWAKRGDTFEWCKELGGLDYRAELRPDPARSCLWYTHTFTNRSFAPMSGLSTYTCLHLVNAPQFISIAGERIWACLDGQWTTTDTVPRQESPDPRRVFFLKEGLREERTVVPSEGFPSATMPEQACHPLMIAESFRSDGSVGIACRDFHRLFNNNDSELRCIHSEPLPIEHLAAGESKDQEGVIVFCQGDHTELVRQFRATICDVWPQPPGRHT